MTASLQQARPLHKPAMGLTGLTCAEGLQFMAGGRLEKGALHLQCASWHTALLRATHSPAGNCTSSLPIVQVPQKISCYWCLQWVS